MMKHKLTQLVFVTVVLFSIFFMFYSYTLNPTKQIVPKYGGTYVHPVPAGIDFSLDPATMYEINPKQALIQIFDTLFRIDSEMKLEPCLCEKWELTNDNKTTICYLKQGVKFHNGQELTSRDIYFSYHYLFKKTSNQSMEAAPIKGIDSYWNGKTNYISGIQTDGPYKISITTSMPVPNFVYSLTNPAFVILPNSFNDTAEKEFFKKPIGTGPFKFVSFNEKEELIMEAFNDYHNGRAYIDHLVFKPYANEQIYSAFEKGEINDLFAFDYHSDFLKNAKNIQVLIHDSYITSLIFFNVTIPPFNDRRYRQMILESLDGNELKQRCGKNSIGSIIPSFIGGHVSDYDFHGPVEHRLKIQDKKAILNSFPKTTIVYPSDYENACFIKVLKEQMARSKLPVTLKIASYDEFQRFLRTGAKEMPMHIDGFAVKNNDAFCILKFFHSNNTMSHTRIKDPVIDNSLAKAREEINPSIRDAIYRGINNRIMEEVYAIPIEQSQQIDIFGTNVHVANNSFGFKYLFNFANIWLD